MQSHTVQDGSHAMLPHAKMKIATGVLPGLKDLFPFYKCFVGWSKIS